MAAVHMVYQWIRVHPISEGYLCRKRKEKIMSELVKTAIENNLADVRFNRPEKIQRFEL